MSFILLDPYNGIIKSSDNPSKTSKAKKILSYEVMSLGNMFSSESTSLRYLKNNEIEIEVYNEFYLYIFNENLKIKKINK